VWIRWVHQSHRDVARKVWVLGLTRGPDPLTITLRGVGARQRGWVALPLDFLLSLVFCRFIGCRFGYAAAESVGLDGSPAVPGSPTDAQLGPGRLFSARTAKRSCIESHRGIEQAQTRCRSFSNGQRPLVPLPAAPRSGCCDVHSCSIEGCKGRLCGCCRGRQPRSRCPRHRWVAPGPLSIAGCGRKHRGLVASPPANLARHGPGPTRDSDREK
jgi:hypothetical protein